jgi:colanic acid/amylovoran/stewartan biosynthesis glycosyltransferase WcaL/AmsK/CpsK
MVTMRVFELVHTYLVPTENWCYQMFRNLPDVEVVIVTECLRDAEAFPLPSARFLVTLFPRDTLGRNWIVRNGTAAARRAVRPLWNRLVMRSARQADVLHAHFSFVGWRYLWLARRVAKPLVVSFYGYDYEWLPTNHPEWRERYHILFENAALFVTEGVNGREKLIRAGCRPDKIRVAHLGVDVDRIPHFTRQKARDELRLVQVATFTAKKGQETTMKAFLRAAPRCPGMTLTFVGKDADGFRPSIQRMAAAAGVANRVRFIDFVPFAKLHDFLRDFHVFIHPSRHSEAGDSEGGAPIVLLDAQATGMPVLSTRHCDIPEEVLDGKTGMLVDENDDAALADKIRRFFEMDATTFAEFSRGARSHVVENYDAKTCARTLRSIYEDVVRRTPK